MAISQTQSGKAFEYALADSFARFFSVPIVVNQQQAHARSAYARHDAQAQEDMRLAAGKACVFLASHEERLVDVQAITLQSDRRGAQGDVRDLLIQTEKQGVIGISAKQRNDAVKHPRLSDKIDFGREWLGYPCRRSYFDCARAVFSLLRDYEREGLNFRDIENKAERIYKPILDAFEKEIRFICDEFHQEAPKRLMCYLIGREDFYWIIKENGNVSVQSCNIGGTLSWGDKWRTGGRIADIARTSPSRMRIIFSDGWQLGLRLHNARSLCEPSLKFDVRLESLPRYVARHMMVWQKAKRSV